MHGLRPSLSLDTETRTVRPVHADAGVALARMEVLVDGKVRKRDGRLVGLDLGKLKTLAQASHDYPIETAKLKSQNWGAYSSIEFDGCSISDWQ